MKKLKTKLYVQLNGTILRCDKIGSIGEIISVNLNDLLKSIDEHTLPLKIAVEPLILDKINKDVAKAACSNYKFNTVKIYANSTLSQHIIEIKSIENPLENKI